MHAGDPTGGVQDLPEKGKENKGNKDTIQMGAVDSPVLDYVVFYFLLNNVHGGQ